MEGMERSCVDSIDLVLVVCVVCDAGEMNAMRKNFLLVQWNTRKKRMSTISLAQIRSVRVGGMALFDLALTFLVGWIFENLFVQQWKWFPCARSYYSALIPIGFVVHMIFNQKTALTVALLEPGVNWQKLIFALLVLGAMMPC